VIGNGGTDASSLHRKECWQLSAHQTDIDAIIEGTWATGYFFLQWTRDLFPPYPVLPRNSTWTSNCMRCASWLIAKKPCKKPS
jgi:hypothetical protein